MSLQICTLCLLLVTARKYPFSTKNRYFRINITFRYQEHALFDYLQTQDKHFVIRIRASTNKTVVKTNDVDSGSIGFFDAEVLLGTEESKNQSQNPVRLVGYHVDGVDYWIATDPACKDLTGHY